MSQYVSENGLDPTAPAANEPQPLSEMTDREILIEIAENMRYTAGMFAGMQQAVSERGIGGLMKDMMTGTKNGKG